MRWAVLVSGTGSNLAAILESKLPVELVLSNRADAPALDMAREHGVPTRVLLAGHYADRRAFDGALCEILEAFGIEAVALAGFLRWLTRVVVDRYPGTLLNLHPSLLPAYPGLHAIERAFRDRVLWTGVTVHFVDEGHDSGPIVAQSPVPRYVHDTLADLSERIHAAEHQLYPCVLHAVDRGSVIFHEGRVCYDEEGTAWMHGR